MAKVADQLREEREAQKLTLSQVAEITKIRADHLAALEEGRFEVFPAPVYVRGSVRTFATLLKMDVPQIMAALETELGGNRKFADGIPVQQPRGILDFLTLQLSKMDLRKTLIPAGVALLLVVIILGYVVWRHHRSIDPLRDLKPGLYQSTQSLSGETLPLPAPRK